MTFYDLKKRWTEFHAPTWTDSTRRVYEDRLLAFHRFCRHKGLPLQHVERITEKNIVDWMNFEHERGRKNVMLPVQTLLSVLNYGIDRRLIRMPTIKQKYLPKFPMAAPEKYPFSEQQYNRVMRVAQSRIDEMNIEELSFDRIGSNWRRADMRTRPRGTYCGYWPLAIALGWHCGLRMSDCCLLKWENVDFDAEVLRVTPHKKRRIGERLEIPIEHELHDHLLKRFNERPDKTEAYVMPKMAYAYLKHRPSLGIQFTRLCRAANLPKHSFHSLRHSFVSRLLNAAVDPITIGSMTGQTIGTIQHYSHVTMEAKSNALARAREGLHKARLVAAGMVDYEENVPRARTTAPEAEASQPTDQTAASALP